MSDNPRATDAEMHPDPKELSTVLAVLYDHGEALGQYGVSRHAFARQVTIGFRTTVAAISRGETGTRTVRGRCGSTAGAAHHSGLAGEGSTGFTA